MRALGLVSAPSKRLLALAIDLSLVSQSIFTTLLVTGSYLPPNTLDHNFSVYSLLKYVVSEVRRSNCSLRSGAIVASSTSCAALITGTSNFK